MSNFRPLEDYSYQVRVSYIHTRSIEDIRIRGNRQSGVDFIDNNTNFEPVTVYINIQRMFQYYKDGVSMVLVKKEDAADIYNKIQSYLDYASHIIHEYHFSDGEDPVELAELDRFANDIYNGNLRKAFSVDIKNKPGTGKNTGFGINSRLSLSKNKPKGTLFSVQDRGDRVSFESGFVRATRNLNGR